MSALAQYVPSFEEVQDPTDFLDASDLVEARLASERADDDVTSVQDIHTSLEALVASMEANLNPDPWTPVFINHALDAIGRRTGLRVPSVSMEDANATVTMEGLGDTLKSIWDAIVKAVKAALKAVADFFKRVYDFVTGKKDKIETNFKKAAKAGDATPVKLAAENTLDKIKDTEVADKIKDKLEEKELVKARPSELVIMTASTASAIERSAMSTGGENKPVMEDVVHQGKHYTVALKKEVIHSKYLKVGNTGNDFISHASCAGISLKQLNENSVEISMADLTELVWETLFRATTIREVGKSISYSVLEISEYAITELRTYFGKNSGKKPGDFNFGNDALNNQLFQRFEAVHAQFKKLRSQSGLIPAGRRVISFNPGKNIYNLYSSNDQAPSLAKFSDRTCLLAIPKWMDSKKASDGVTSLMVLNTQRNLIDDINKRFDQALAKWDDTVKWVQTQGHGDKTDLAVKYITDYCKHILTDTQSNLNRFMRSQLAMEGTLVQCGDMLAGIMGRLADSKDLVEEFA